MKKFHWENLFYVVCYDGSFWSEHKKLSVAKKALAREQKKNKDLAIGIAKITLVHRAVKK